MSAGLWFSGVNPTVDLVMIEEGCDPHILMVRRSTDPFKGWLALPGGFIDSKTGQGERFISNESPSAAAQRELLEETGIQVVGALTALGIFEGKGRDPRDTAENWTRSHAFMTRVKRKPDTTPQAGEVIECVWAKASDIRDGRTKCAFDHRKIIMRALAEAGL